MDRFMCEMRGHDMGNMKRYLIIGMSLLVIASIGCTGTQSSDVTTTTQAPATPAPTSAPVTSNAKMLFEYACSECHSIDWPTSKRMNLTKWQSKVNDMVARGASLTDEEAALVAEYLAETYGPESG